MPRIPDELLNCTVFLYPDDARARTGSDIGGSGFLVGRPFPASGKDHVILWLVTNRHVVEHGALVVRVNTCAGGFDTIETTEKEWFFHPDGDDLAIRPIALSGNHHKVGWLTLDWLLTKETLEKYAVGPGDEAYMIGRFVTQEGRAKNTPTCRFGNIAQMPIEKIVYEGQEQESFLVEMRSMGGYSGSPVFVYLDAAYYRPIDTPGRFDAGPWLLGVDWCMIPLWEQVCDQSGQELTNGWQVPANTGMMGVIPAWRLHWLLMEYDQVVKRSQEIEEAELKRRPRGPAVIPTVASDVANRKNPEHREDFTRLLNAAARKQELKD